MRSARKCRSKRAQLRRPRTSASGTVAQGGDQCRGQSVGVARLDQPGIVRAERLDRAADAAGHGGNPERHRLEQCQRQPLEQRGQDEEVGGGDQVGDIAALAEQEDRVAQVSCRNQRLERGPLRPFARQQELGLRRCPQDRARRLDEHRMRLLRGQPGNGQHDPLASADAEGRPGDARGSTGDGRLDAVADRDQRAARKARRAEACGIGLRNDDQPCQRGGARAGARAAGRFR